VLALAVDRELLGREAEVDGGRVDDQRAEAVPDDGDHGVLRCDRAHFALRTNSVGTRFALTRPARRRPRPSSRQCAGSPTTKRPPPSADTGSSTVSPGAETCSAIRRPTSRAVRSWLEWPAATNTGRSRSITGARS